MREPAVARVEELVDKLPDPPIVTASSALDPLLADRMPDSHLTMLFSVLAERPGPCSRKKQHVKLRCLLDTGSSACFISDQYKSFFAANGAVANVHMANGAKQSVEFGKVKLTFGGCAFDQSVGCMPMGDSFDIVLGDDWLNKYKAHLNYDRNDDELTGKDERSVSFTDPVSSKQHLIPVPSHFRDAVLNSVVHNTAAALRTGGKDSDSDYSHAFVVHLNAVAASGDYLPAPPPHPVHNPLLPHHIDDDDDEQGDQLHVETESLRSDITNLVDEFADRFPADVPGGLPPDRPGVAHAIPLKPGEHTPPSRKYYRLTPAEKLEVEKRLLDLLEKDWIQLSGSPYAAPVMFVAKKDGGLRMCVDYRKLNDQTIKNKYPLPRIDELLDCLHGAKYFSALDLQQAYHQVRLREEDYHKTAFITHKGQFEYKVLCFGLSNAPSTFQALMNRVLQEHLSVCCLVYMDDVLVYSHTPEEHVQHLRLILQTLRKAQLYCKLSKCRFAVTSLPFLGQLVGHDGIRPNPAKVAVLVDWPLPENAHDLRCFLGLAQYLSKYIEGYAVMTTCLQALLKKNAEWCWTDDCTTAFQTVKEAITNSPVLVLPDPELPYEVITDACKSGLGAVLMQNDHPIAFVGGQLSKAEQNYTTQDMELLGVMYALQQWRCYLHGAKHPFTLVTDHHPNTYFSSKPLLSSRQARWSQKLQLQDYDFTWAFRQGAKNIADPISRRPYLLGSIQAEAAGMHFDWVQRSGGLCTGLASAMGLHADFVNHIVDHATLRPQPAPVVFAAVLTRAQRGGGGEASSTFCEAG